MAFHADTIWEIRTTGDNVNGGGWRDYGGASTDYSNQDAAQLNRTNCSISGTTLTDDDAGGLFTDAMIGSIVNILTVGRYQITARADGDNVTLDAAPGDTSGKEINVGGAVEDYEEINSLYVAGNTVWLKKGSYSLSGHMSYNHATAGSPTRIRGYDSARGDEPTGADRPTYACSTWNASFGQYVYAEDIIFTLDTPGGVNMYIGGKIRNCKSTNVNASAASAAIKLASSGDAIDCEAINASGYGIMMSNDSCNVSYCEVHGCRDGIYNSTGPNQVMEENSVWDCSRYGIFVVAGGRAYIHHNTIDDCDIGIYLAATPSKVRIINNQVTHNVTRGIDSAAAASILQAMIDYNNFHGNTGGDVNNCTKDLDNTADDPAYNNAATGDFTDVADANAFGNRLM